MTEIARLSGCSDWIELEFVERERTPSELMKLGIRLHLAGLSLSNTIQELEKFGVKQSRKAVHDWVQKADLQPVDEASPDHVALDETVIRINGQQFWLYAGRYRHEQIPSYTAVYDDYNRLNTAVSARPSRETRR